MWNLLKDTAWDVSIIYKNFLHFSISKIIISLVWILYAIILSIPFLIVIFFVYMYITKTGNFWIVNSYPFIAFSIFWIFVLILALLYIFVLMTNLNVSYLNWEKLWYSKNPYFNLKLFIKYFKISLIIAIISILPFLFYNILTYLLITIFSTQSGSSLVSNPQFLTYLGVFFNFLWIVFFIIFTYIFYRTIFSIIILLDESKWEKFEKIFYYIKKSFNLTKGLNKFFKFFVVVLFFIILTLPITLPLNYFSSEANEINTYIESKSNPNPSFPVENLEEKYSWGDLNVLNEKLSKYRNYSFIFEILNFLLIFGLFEMIFLSYYFRVLKNKNLNKKSGLASTIEQVSNTNSARSSGTTKTKRKTSTTSKTTRNAPTKTKASTSTKTSKTTNASAKKPEGKTITKKTATKSSVDKDKTESKEIKKKTTRKTTTKNTPKK